MLKLCLCTIESVVLWVVVVVVTVVECLHPAALIRRMPKDLNIKHLQNVS